MLVLNMKNQLLIIFTEKYVIDGKAKIIPFEYFKEKAPQIRDFFKKS